MSSSKPEVSVIIACRNGARTIRICLDSLLRQRTARSFEVIVADSSTDATPEIIRSEYPAVRLMHSHTRMFPGEARNAAIRESQGPLLAFLDADCEAYPDWLEAMAQAQESCNTTVGGAIENAACGSRAGWAAYFCEFSIWMPPGRKCLMPEIPACSLSVRREVYKQFGPFEEGVYCSDTAFHYALAAAGRSARFEPRVRIRHHGISEAAEFLRHERFHGESFGRMRMRRGGLGSWKRAALVLAAPLLPALQWLRIARRVFSNRACRKEFLLCTPLLLAGLAAWAFGEWRAYSGLTD
jgi:glycosyltransferase involved in cell wall biosynthesis